MTNEGAMVTLKDILMLRSEAYYEAIQNGGKKDVAEETYFDVLNTAIKALEKQIPQKPIVNGKRNPDWDAEAYLCPKCFNYVGWCKYCECCGQAIDWSEDET